MTIAKEDFKQISSNVWEAQAGGHSIILISVDGKLRVLIRPQAGRDARAELDQQQWTKGLRVTNQFFQELRVADLYQ